MVASHLTLVADTGRQVQPTPEPALPAARDPREAAFLQTMELAVRQARRILERPGEHSVQVRGLCQIMLDQAAAVTAIGIDETDWGVEPFVGA
jgi:hypothetical protein